MTENKIRATLQNMKKGILILLILILAGCGRISKPQPPDGSTYPGEYVVKE